MNFFSVDFETLDNNKVRAILNFNSDINDKDAEIILNDFKTEVLDQDLRETIKNKTEATRNLIIAHAFSNTEINKDE